MKYAPLPSQSELLSLFDYRDGVLYWKENTKNNAIKKGTKAGHFCNTHKYCHIRIKSIKYRLHRIIWKMLKGYDPKELDHINRVKHDNRIENLREVTGSQNLYNKGPSKNTASGVKGVSFDTSTKKWRVRIYVEKKEMHFGFYSDFELACLVVAEAKAKYQKIPT